MFNLQSYCVFSLFLTYIRDNWHDILFRYIEFRPIKQRSNTKLGLELKLHSVNRAFKLRWNQMSAVKRDSTINAKQKIPRIMIGELKLDLDKIERKATSRWRALFIHFAGLYRALSCSRISPLIISSLRGTRRRQWRRHVQPCVALYYASFSSLLIVD